MKVIYKKTIGEQISEARIQATMQGKEIEKIILTREEARDLYKETFGFISFGTAKTGDYYEGIPLEVEA